MMYFPFVDPNDGSMQQDEANGLYTDSSVFLVRMSKTSEGIEMTFDNPVTIEFAPLDQRSLLRRLWDRLRGRKAPHYQAQIYGFIDVRGEAVSYDDH